MGRTPPTRLVTVATGVREALQSLVRRMVPPPVSVLELASGFMTTQLLYAVARLGVADVLGVRSLPADEVAAELGTSPDATYRLLRACAAAGILREDSAHRFSTTPLGDQLRSGPGSVRPVVLMLGDPGYQAVWGRLPQSVTTGTPAAGAVFGRSMWEQLDEDREFGTVFDEAMTRLTELDWPAIAAAHDFTGVGTVVDVGGGRGRLLSLVLGAAPDAKGVLLEREAVAVRAREHLRSAGVLDRCRVEVGSFFESVPSDGDLYLLRRVVHDLDDEDAVDLLTTVRTHMPRHARLLLVECVVAEHSPSPFATSLDLDMLLFVGGRERTQAQLAGLLDRAGLRLTRVVPTISPVSLVEAVPGRHG